MAPQRLAHHSRPRGRRSEERGSRDRMALAWVRDTARVMASHHRSREASWACEPTAEAVRRALGKRRRGA
jgi:hypothetical protein